MLLLYSSFLYILKLMIKIDCKRAFLLWIRILENKVLGVCRYRYKYIQKFNALNVDLISNLDVALKKEECRKLIIITTFKNVNGLGRWQ